MAHNIDTSTGKPAIAFRGDRNDIWHRLGAEMPAGASIDDWAAKAGLNWQAVACPAMVDLTTLAPDGFGNSQLSGLQRIETVDGRKFVVRNDNGHVLSTGTVSDGYHIVQPKDVLDWFQRYIAVDDRFELDVAGSLKKGEIIWATAVYRDPPKVANEAHVARLLMTTTFDGSGSTINKATMVRVVCNNTLDAALADGGKSVVRTRHSSKFNPAKVGQELASIAKGFESYKAMGDAMASVEMSTDQVSRFFKACLDIPFDAKQDDISSRKKNQFDELSAAWGVSRRERNESKDHASVWTALQSVTRYVDHQKSVRNGGGDVQEARLLSAQFGSGAQLKEKAVAILTTMAPDLNGPQDSFKDWLKSQTFNPAQERATA